MTFLTLLTDVWVPAIVSGADKVPAPEDVKAGWVAFAVFIALAVAIVFLGISMNRHLRKTRDNAALGAFGPIDKERESHS